MRLHKARQSSDLHLIPAPRSLERNAGEFVIPADMHVVIAPQGGRTDLFAAERLIIEAETLCATKFHLSLGLGVDARQEIRAAVDSSFAPRLATEIRGQAYRLSITPAGIQLTAFAQPGLFYAFQTLLQILREVSWRTHPPKPPKPQQGKRAARQANEDRKSKIKNLHLPCLTINDHPDFVRRGVYHDTARGKVPKVETLLQLIDNLGHLKYNEFQLYIENNFQFRRHPDMYDDTDPFTAEELLLLDSACRARHMDFVPSLTSLGHFEKILNRPRYRPLAEAEPGQLKAMGAPCWHEAAPWSLCVTDPRAKALLSEMYAEFAPNFSSGQFNICCDEAYDLGRVRSKKLADKIGTGQMYVDWINFCDRLVKSHGSGKSIQMWGDIILNHPELIAQLPADATLLEWGYEHDHKFKEHCKSFAERLRVAAVEEKRKDGKKEIRKEGNKEIRSESPSQSLISSFPHSLNSFRSFYVAPGTSSWLTLSARTQNACGNIHNAATAGLKYGARGILVTDWGDQGHQQLLAVSLVPFAYGAAAGWNLAATPNPCQPDASHIENGKRKIADLLTAASLHLFEDPTGQFADLAYDLGLIYLRLGWQRFNGSLDHFLFREKWDFANFVNRAPAKALGETAAETWKLLHQFLEAQSVHPDAAQIKAEFVLTCRQVIHTCLRTQLRQRWLAADPARRNPEEPTLREKPPKPLPPEFQKAMTSARREALDLRRDFAILWLARNKKSRLTDITAEFDLLAAEYLKFSR